MGHQHRGVSLGLLRDCDGSTVPALAANEPSSFQTGCCKVAELDILTTARATRNQPDLPDLGTERLVHRRLHARGYACRGPARMRVSGQVSRLIMSASCPHVCHGRM